MNDLVEGTKTTGEIIFRNRNIYNKSVDPVTLRKQIGMVFQKPNPFPKNISENITWGAKING